MDSHKKKVNHPINPDEICILCIGKKQAATETLVCSYCYKTWENEQTKSVAKMKGFTPIETWILARIDLESKMAEAETEIQKIKDQARNDVEKQLKEHLILGDFPWELVKARERILWQEMNGNKWYARLKRLELLNANLPQLIERLEQRIEDQRSSIESEDVVTSGV